MSDSGLKWSATGAAVFGGYRFNENFAVELGYRNLGSNDVLGVDLKANSTQLSMLGTLPMSKEWGVYGRLGINTLHAKATAAGVTASDRQTKALIGAGLRYEVSPTVGLRLEVQKPYADTNTVAFGAEFRF